MPQVTVYVRVKDLERWKAIKDKSEFLSRAINEQSVPSSPAPTDYIKSKPVIVPKKFADKITTADRLPTTGSKTKLCSEHLIEPEFCKMMKHTGKKNYN